MTGTDSTVSGESTVRLATAYERDDVAGRPVVEDGPDGRWSRPPAFESGGGGLVSTADDFLAFASALLAGGTHRGERVLSGGVGGADDQRATESGAEGGLRVLAGLLRRHGLGFGMSVRTRRTHLGTSAGSYGWPGYGTAWHNDPAEDLITILVMQRAHAGDERLSRTQDFWTTVYQTIDV